MTVTSTAAIANDAVPTGHAVLRLRSEFALTVWLPRDQAVWLFGAHGERAWAGAEWQPEFLHPLPAQDTEGSVFFVSFGGPRRLGYTTTFDLPGGHVRHVFLLGDRCATVIDIRLAAVDAGVTRVAVVYERTSLRPDADDEVRALASGDADQGPEWEAAIEEVAPSLRQQGTTVSRAPGEAHLDLDRARSSGRGR